MSSETVTITRLEALIEDWERSKRYLDSVARKEEDERAAAQSQRLGLCIGHLREMISAPVEEAE